MYQVSLAAGNDFPDVQLRLMSSPTSYMSSCPVMSGPSSGRTVTMRAIETIGLDCERYEDCSVEREPGED
jgi:hypothetical protein